AELYEFRRRQQMLGYASLAEVPAEQLDSKSERIQHYFNAVYCWARAMLNERYQDYDATASGVKRGEELAELYEFRRRQQMLGYASLAEVPAEQLDSKSERI
ncbi:head completion/stabilization protein, partial [Escherichia coli]